MPVLYIAARVSLLPSAGIQTGCGCLAVCVQEGQSRALLCTQLDAVRRSLAGQEVPDQLNLTVLYFRNARTQMRNSLNQVKYQSTLNQHISANKRLAFDPTYQLLTISLSLLPAPDLHIYLVAGMFQLDLQGAPLRLRSVERLFARSQFVL